MEHEMNERESCGLPWIHRTNVRPEEVVHRETETQEIPQYKASPLILEDLPCVRLHIGEPL